LGLIFILSKIEETIFKLSYKIKVLIKMEMTLKM